MCYRACSNEQFIMQQMEIKKIFLNKWLSTRRLNAHLAESLPVYPSRVLDCLLLCSTVELVHSLGSRGFINVFSRSGQLVFTGRQNLLELNFFIGKLSARWSNQAGKIILTGSQFAWCQALNESLVSTNLLEGIKRFYFA